jgi:hypothetical protein
MTTVQIIGVSVAGAAVLLLIIALIVTRRRESDEAQNDAQAGSSFLDQAPQDTFSVLGKPEQPVEDITLDPAVERADEAEPAAAETATRSAEVAERAAAATVPEKQPQPGGLGLDWGPDLSVRQLASDPVAAPGWGDETEITGELRAETPEPREDTPPAPGEESVGQAAAPEPARPAEGGPAAGDEAAQESGSDSRLVPLSDIIVTTSSKMVDLGDSEVRRMLTELVTFEIDQAADFRRRGQDIDAVLQLTEAEKVARALGMTESAQRIRAMMSEIDEQE